MMQDVSETGSSPVFRQGKYLKKEADSASLTLCIIKKLGDEKKPKQEDYINKP
jgi:hypothetical protein